MPTARPSGSTVRDAAATLWLVLKESSRSFSANKNLQAAATLAFYGFLSLMPFLLLVIFLFGRVLNSSEQALDAVRSVTNDLFPAFNEEILDDLLKLAGQKAWGLISVIVLMWSMTPFASAVRSAIRQIFKTEGRIHYIKAKLGDLSAVFAVLALFMSLVAIRVYLNFSAGGWALLEIMAPLVLSALVLTFFYAVFAPPGTTPAHLLTGAVTATLLLAVMRPLFVLMLEYNPSYGYAFGSLKAIFLLLIWVYYTFAAILLGAEVMANARRRESLILRGLFSGGAPARPSRLVEKFVCALDEGEALFKEGDAGSEMFYVQSGAISLTKNGRELKRAGPGDYFGEMSMLINAPRTAAAVAAVPNTRVIVISHDNFDTILRENPGIVQTILKEMATRLKATNERLEESRQ